MNGSGKDGSWQWRQLATENFDFHKSKVLGIFQKKPEASIISFKKKNRKKDKLNAADIIVYRQIR